MALAPGSSVGHYRIVGSLGAGGMGEVYRAHDTKLGREVALKILPEVVSADPERRARFAREARALAALNHPNIAQVHGFEDGEPTSALIMELVEGEDLSERIRRGAIQYDEAIAIARQIGEALQAAHDRGIVHRDLKPGNIKVREDGTVKVLDFGLAKALERLEGDGFSRRQDAEDAEAPSLQTITTPAMTLQGVILGTAAYMAPEQAKGKSVTRRADIWAFGCVLYEMLTGRRAFAGEDVSDTLASILKSDVDWNGVPPRAVRLLRKCLEKDPRRRLHDIGDAWDLLDDDAVRVEPAPSRSSWLPWTMAVLFLLSTLALVALRFTGQATVPSTARFQIAPPPKFNFDIYLALSPDGKRLAFTAVNAEREITLWVRDLESLEARQLPGTDGAASPFWSPDSRYLAFSAGRLLKKIDISGGPPQTLTESTGTVGLGAWNADGVIVFGTRGFGPIRRVAATGGPATDLTSIDLTRGENIHAFPHFLPDGHRFLYWRQASRPEFEGIYVGSIDKAASEQDNTVLVPTSLGPVAIASARDGGRLLFVRDGTLLAQPFDTSRATVSGDPVPMAEQIGSNGSFGFFTAGADVLAFRNGSAAFGSRERLTWLGRKGETLGTVGEPLALAAAAAAITIAPNGRQASVLIAAQSLNPDLWIVELGRGIASRFTFNEAPETGPVWSPDGARIAFRSMRQGGFDLFTKDVNGTADESAIMPSRTAGIPNDWSPDGRFLVFSRFNGASDADLLVLAFQDKTVVPLLQTQFSEQGAQFSPDGRWISYTSNESGGNEIYLRPFLVSADGKPSLGPKWRVSTDGGASSRWRGDGRELFYRTRTGAMIAVDVSTTGSGVETGNPRLLFTPATTTVGWDVTPDGQRFLMSFPVMLSQAEQRPPEPITVVLNWQTALQKK